MTWAFKIAAITQADAIAQVERESEQLGTEFPSEHVEAVVNTIRAIGEGPINGSARGYVDHVRRATHIEINLYATGRA